MELVMTGEGKNVLPKMTLLRESFAVDAVSEIIFKIRRTKSMVDSQIGDRVFVDEGTIRNAKNGNGKISFVTLFNLLTIDPLALEPLLNFFGRRSVPTGSICDTDPLEAVTDLTHKLCTKQDNRDVDAALDTAIEALLKLKNERMLG